MSFFNKFRGAKHKTSPVRHLRAKAIMLSPPYSNKLCRNGVYGFFIAPLFAASICAIPISSWSNDLNISSRISPTGIPVNSIIDIEVEGIIFSIPAAYFQIWPGKQYLNRLNIYKTPPGWLKGFDFNYWMPTGRSEEIKTDPPMVVQALIERGANPAPDEFPISVLHAKIVPPSGLDNIRPTQRFANLLARESTDKDIVVSEFGLKKYILGGDPTRTRIYYTNNNYIEMLLECQSTSPSPKCAGDVYLPDKQISFRLIIPEKNIKAWYKVLDTTAKLIEGWKHNG